MKIVKQISLILMLLNISAASAQTDSSPNSKKHFSGRKLTIEPGIGINPAPMSDLLISNVIQWNFFKRLSIVSHTSYTYNNAFLRDFNYIKTNYDYSLSQKFGIGASFYTKRSTHTFSLLAGIRKDAFKETLENPEFEKLSVSGSSDSPDIGFLYNVKVGKKKYFFSYRMYIPLYPYPFMTSDTWSIDRNLANVSLEFGLGIRLK